MDGGCFFAMAQGFCLRRKQQQTVSGLLAKRPKDLQHFGAVYLAAVVVQFQVFTQPGCKPCLTFFRVIQERDEERGRPWAGFVFVKFPCVITVCVCVCLFGGERVHAN